MDPQDPDAARRWDIPAEVTAVEGRVELNAELPMEPSGWGVREALTYDLPVLLPAEHTAALQRFSQSTASRAGRVPASFGGPLVRAPRTAPAAGPVIATCRTGTWS